MEKSTAVKVIGIDASRANRPQKTGVEWYAYHVIQSLKSVVPGRYKVVLYTEEPLRNGLERLPPNWENRVLRWPPRRLWTQMRLSWEMLVRPPDLLFVPAHVIPLISPRRTAVTLHDVAFMVRPEAYRPIGRAYLRLMYRIAARRAAILTVSEFSKREIAGHFGVDAGRIAVTPLGYDASRYFPAPEEEVRKRLAGYGINRPYFLFVGRLETKKNIVGLLAAFRDFKEKRGNGHRLVLVGKSGYGYERALESIERSGAKASVVQKGYVAPDDMRHFYAGAEALVFPSWYEGFGLPVLEAFACGTPVIASRIASIPEVGGNAVLYVDPADPKGIAEAMVRIVDDRRLGQELSEKGLARAKDFSWEKTAARTWEALRRHLGE